MINPYLKKTVYQNLLKLKNLWHLNIMVSGAAWIRLEKKKNLTKFGIAKAKRGKFG